MQPSIGRIVHYVSRGSADGTYPSECRAAIVTELAHADESSDVVGLAVLNPTGQHFTRAPYDDGAETLGNPDCPDQTTHGNPFRYCACGWTEAQLQGGTWHWPEPTED